MIQRLLYQMLLCCTLTIIAACSGTKPASHDFTHAVERAHGGEIWDSKQAVQADLYLNFRGKKRLHGRMISDTPVGRSRFDLDDGTTMVFDGKTAWIHPANAPYPKPRFDVLTWPYFLAAPFKLNDPGTHLVSKGRMVSQKKEFDVVHLSFESGVGDTPDDWYLAYKDPTSNQLKALAYIVTYSKSIEEANKKPHVIVYDGYTSVDGVLLATSWKFYNWNEEDGATGEAIGTARLENIRFVDISPETFARPPAAVEAPALNIEN